MQSSSSAQRLRAFLPAIIATVALMAPVSTRAQDDAAGGDGTGVARLSLIDGSVAIQRGDSGQSLAVGLNAPVLGGDYLSTGDNARTEVQIDGSAQIRLGQDAQIRFTHLDTGNLTVQLAQGTLELRLLDRTDGASEIDTPSIAVKPQRRGAYRVTVTPDGQTLVTVRTGEAQIDTPQQTQDLQPGSTFIAQGSADNPSTQTVAQIARDDFDRFNTERDRLHERALSDAAFVNTDIGGVEDLDANGRWVMDGSYGHVWIPAAVGPDWAPYREGRWVWEDGYGWTWVAAEPWGWAPYHYGSWYHSPDYGWCWYPPQPRIYAPWRPALVAFIGFGAGSAFSLGFNGGGTFDNVGWVPLAPYEPYHPWWRNRYGYNGGNTAVINNVTNVTNVTNLNVYRNVRYNAVSSVTSQRFLQGDFTRNRAVSVTQLQGAQVFRSAVPIVPTAANLRFTDRAGTPPLVVHRALVQRAFAGNGVVVGRTKFSAQRSALATATHASFTPLNFKDAPTTPVLAPRILTPPAVQVGRPIIGARTLDRPANTLPIRIRPLAAPTYARPAAHPAATDPWTRFNQSRPANVAVPHAEARNHEPERLPRTTGTYHAPGATGTFHASGATGTNRPPGATGAERQPAATETSHAPSYAVPSAARSSTHTDRSAAPAHATRIPEDTRVYRSPTTTPYRPPSGAERNRLPPGTEPGNGRDRTSGNGSEHRAGAPPPTNDGEPRGSESHSTRPPRNEHRF